MFPFAVSQLGLAFTTLHTNHALLHMHFKPNGFCMYRSLYVCVWPKKHKKISTMHFAMENVKHLKIYIYKWRNEAERREESSPRKKNYINKKKYFRGVGSSSFSCRLNKGQQQQRNLEKEKRMRRDRPEENIRCIRPSRQSRMAERSQQNQRCFLV